MLITTQIFSPLGGCVVIQIFPSPHVSGERVTVKGLN